MNDDGFSVDGIQPSIIYLYIFGEKLLHWIKINK